MKYESGTHRVQRVPETESGGRIHTSTMTVAIMPEVDDAKYRSTRKITNSMYSVLPETAASVSIRPTQQSV